MIFLRPLTKVWNVDPGGCLQVLQGHAKAWRAWLTWLAFSLVSCDFRTCVKHRDSQAVNSAAFSPDDLLQLGGFRFGTCGLNASGSRSHWELGSPSGWRECRNLKQYTW